MTKTNKNQQNRTKSGLTPIQEQAAILLASGETITAISEKLDINRSTIYEWQEVMTFRCYYNKQCESIKEQMKAGLFGLQEEAINAIRGSLQSDNASVRLKAATWLLERLSNTEIKDTDPISIIRRKCDNTFEDAWNFDTNKFKKLLEAYNLEAPENL